MSNVLTAIHNSLYSVVALKEEIPPYSHTRQISSINQLQISHHQLYVRPSHIGINI